MKTLLITGGSGFIGSNFILSELTADEYRVVNLDLLTYAGNPASLESVSSHPGYTFIHGDICDRELLRSILLEHRPAAILNFAAESHVDRSIAVASEFIRTNVAGTFVLLEECLGWWRSLSGDEAEEFRFLHISTDEVYGSLGLHDKAFTEESPYAPNSPYAASKASADHLVRAWHRTHGLPVLTTNCSNNYGPRQFPEKLIPLIILNALEGKPLPVYGDGGNIRDWVYVDDHCDAVRQVLKKGQPGQTYNVGAGCEKTNLEVVRQVCLILDEILPNSQVHHHASLIQFVKDRPGHDLRYAIDSSKLERQLGWRAMTPFERGLEKTVDWYLSNPEWVNSVRTGAYRDWIDEQYGPG